MSTTENTDAKPLPVRVLVIEDDEALATMLLRVLQRDRHFVTHARDGEEGIAAFEREQPHVVLIDGLLPKKNGFEVCRELRALAGDRAGLLMMSASFKTLSMRSEAFRDAGADGFLSKPFVLAELRKRVVELAERSSTNKKRDARSQGRTPAARTRTREMPAVGSAAPVAFDTTAAVVAALLRCARDGTSGILKLEHESSVLELAFLRGILVGARDNLRENQLGERLLREGRITHDDLKRVNERVARGERVAEALVAMGLLDAVEALSFIENQVRERLGRALGWRTGTLTLVVDEAAAHRMAVEGYDLQQEILAWALDPARDAAAAAFLLARGDEHVERTADFEEGLHGFARVRPRSTLPLSLAVGDLGTLDALGARHPDGARDLYALWISGLLRLGGDPLADARPLPRPLLVDEGEYFVDREAASRVAAQLLKMRGRSFYDALGVPRDEVTARVAIRLEELEREVGVDALGGFHLGPARLAAHELWALLADIRVTLLNPEARAAYDESLAPATPPRPRVAPDADPEQAFLDGQMALERGDARAAREAFEVANRARPNDPDFNAWLAWASILEGEEGGGDERFALDILETAARAFPQAMRPEYFLGLAANRRGERERAREHLREAVARAPNDVEARRALDSLGA